MPIDLERNGVHRDEWILLHPGAYACALRRVCTESVRDRYAALRCEDAAELANLKRAEAWRSEAMVRKRRGEPVHCLSHHLPDELLRRFPRGHHAFVVTPDDLARLKPTPIARAVPHQDAPTNPGQLGTT